MDVFSSQLRMIKCSEIRHFSMKFPSEGESCHCHFAGKKLGASNQIFQPKYVLNSYLPGHQTMQEKHCGKCKGIIKNIF